MFIVLSHPLSRLFSSRQLHPFQCEGGRAFLRKDEGHSLERTKTPCFLSSYTLQEELVGAKGCVFVSVAGAYRGKLLSAGEVYLYAGEDNPGN